MLFHVCEWTYVVLNVVNVVNVLKVLHVIKWGLLNIYTALLQIKIFSVHVFLCINVAQKLASTLAVPGEHLNFWGNFVIKTYAILFHFSFCQKL